MKKPPPRCKVAVVLIDGIGDVSVEELGGLTPLQAANTPYMDAIAAGGLNGLMDPVAPGLACGSDTAHLSLLGYNPINYYRGRGAFESMGAGLDMQPGDIAFKSNFATLDTSTGIVLHRRADRRFEVMGPILCEYLDGLSLPSFPQYTVRVKYATEHRCGVVVHGGGLTDAITGTDPLKDNLPLLVATPKDRTPAAAHTAAVVNELSTVMHTMLENHPVNAQRRQQGENPANIVLLRGCGSRLAVESFHHKHGLRGCVVAPTKIIAGLAMSCGLDLLQAPGATGDYRTRFDSKARTIVQALTGGGDISHDNANNNDDDNDTKDDIKDDKKHTNQDHNTYTNDDKDTSDNKNDTYDFAFLHVKAVDDTGHDRAVHLKVGYLEAVDIMVGQLLHGLWEYEQQQQEQQQAATESMHTTTTTTITTTTNNNNNTHMRTAVVLAADHSTPVVFGDHSHEPVPVALAYVTHAVECLGGPTAVAHVPMGLIPHPVDGGVEGVVRAGRAAAAKSGRDVGRAQRAVWDVVTTYDEVAAARGALGRFPGSEFMPLVRQFCGVE